MDYIFILFEALFKTYTCLQFACAKQRMPCKNGKQSYKECHDYDIGKDDIASELLWIQIAMMILTIIILQWNQPQWYYLFEQCSKHLRCKCDSQVCPVNDLQNYHDDVIKWKHFFYIQCKTYYTICLPFGIFSRHSVILCQCSCHWAYTWMLWNNLPRRNYPHFIYELVLMSSNIYWHFL